MLVHTTDQDPGIRRKGAGKGFYYVHPNGLRVKNHDVIERIRSLAIPPAYRDVWICPIPNGHLQATGWDDRGRKQYRYHPEWHELQKLEKFDRLRGVGAGLPRLRRRLRKDLDSFAGEKRHVVAAAVRLIDKLGHRVGNEAYLKENGSRGISTLEASNVAISEDSYRIELAYSGKGGKEVVTEFSDPILSEVLAQCHELPGQRLFNYEGRGGTPIAIRSSDINDYLEEVYEDSITSKDLRTWRASTEAVNFLRKIRVPEDREAEIRDAIRHAADEIGNRFETCRKHYVHPGVGEFYLASGRWGISRMRPKAVPELQLGETLLLRILERL